MKNWKKNTLLVVSVAGAGMLFLDGCTREDPVVVPQAAQAAPAAPVADQQVQPVVVAAQPQYVIVQQAPPQVIVEEVPAAPSGGQVWIAGSWGWENQKYVWARGRYEAPPQVGAVWVAPRYERDAKGYRYTPGNWQRHEESGGRDRH